MNIEAEIRSFITKEQYNFFLDFFAENAKLIKEDEQETHYFDTLEDLRIQENRFFSKIWMKKGKIHDEQREEIEVKLPKEDFDKLQKIFVAAGHNVKIKWFRKRHEFDWNGISVCLDFTKGYGYIIELEKMCSESEKDEAVEILKQKLSDLNVKQTPREEFEEKFKYYQENWRNLLLIMVLQ
ncbi:CYTH domain-containing protein [Candidatus Pacearchaeota archaeon]|nr:CYTH domain-containing protein [Candidatus Pacearchaeota archaeon]